MQIFGAIFAIFVVLVFMAEAQLQKLKAGALGEVEGLPGVGRTPGYIGRGNGQQPDQRF